MPRKEDEPLTDEELAAIEQAARGYVIGGIVERSGAGPDNTLRLVAEVQRHRSLREARSGSWPSREL